MWYDAGRDVVVYDPPDPDRLTELAQGAKRLHNGYVAVPASLYNLQIARYLNLPSPAPLEIHGYDWPGRFTPFTAQRVTANFLTLNPRAFVLNDMGTGKTLSALWAADYVMSQYPEGACRALIVTTLSTMHRAWADEIFQSLLGRRTAVVIHGTAEKRRELLQQPHDFYIINHDGLGIGAPEDAKAQPRGLYADLLARTDIRMAIVDEAAVYKDGTTRRHRVARAILKPRDYLWMMTGTPTPNGPTDAHGLARLVNGAHGESFTSYKARTMMKLGAFKWVPRTGAMAEARKLLQPAVRFSISDCMDLPPCTVQRRDVDFSADQGKAFAAMKRDLQLQMRDGRVVTAANEAVLRLKLIQISCGAMYDASRAVHRIDAAPRLKVLREILEETQDKVIIFAPLTSVLNVLYSELKEFTRELVYGEVSSKERDRIFKAFQTETDPRILIADPGTMAHGLTLTAATTIVWYAPIDRTEIYLQANKRIDRPGQTKATTIVQLAATPIEREIYRRLDNNETMQGVMLNLIKGDRYE